MMMRGVMQVVYGGKTTVNLKTGHFDSIDSAVIISSHRRSQDFQLGGRLNFKKSYATAGTDSENFGGGMQI